MRNWFWGISEATGDLYSHRRRTSLGMIAWLITGLVCIAAAMTFAEVAIMIPKTGGMVAYLEEAFGRKVGFLAGWMQTILFYPAMIAALSVAFASRQHCS